MFCVRELAPETVSRDLGIVSQKVPGGNEDLSVVQRDLFSKTKKSPTFAANLCGERKLPGPRPATTPMCR